MNTYTTQPDAPTMDAVRYRHPSPRAYRMLMHLRAAAALLAACAGVYVGATMELPTQDAVAVRISTYDGAQRVFPVSDRVDVFNPEADISGGLIHYAE